ncbi:AAA family ATPase [Streptomyces microflavus]|uniref:ATP-binding protein n=1 Tax=Streptomyces microflavus TaxID=1919 RepID=UPI00225B0495|nr:ATP-binding protein [Streptomyces microflavus]MCX4657375.1 AAA family ATPase [Streptomyces microflavus]
MNRLTLAAGTMCTLIGPPGCGKSTFAAQWPDNWRVSLDFYRKLAADTETDQSATPVAVQAQDLFLDARLARGLTTIVDSTNLRAPVRAGLLARAVHWQRPTVAVLFDVPLATVEAQNAGRDRVVPAHVVREFHGLLPTADQLHDEGWPTVRLASTLTRPAR